MNPKEKITNKLFYFSAPVVMGLVILICSLLAITKFAPAEEVVFSQLTTLSYASMALFIILCLFGLYADNLYFTFLIFVILAFPAPVNDFFPGTWLGNAHEPGSAVFPFFTHIDIYLLLGIIKAVFKNNRLYTNGSSLITLVVASLFVSVFVNFFIHDSSHELLLLVQGLFQFRYLIALYLLLSFYDLNRHKNNILLGFVFSVLFLFVESMLYTYKTGSNTLSSGSLANNVFASVIAAILLFLFFVLKKYNHSYVFKTIIFTAILAAIVIIILTGARMAILAFFISYFFVSFIESNKIRSLTRKIYWAITLLLFIGGVVIAANHLPKRYNPHTITDKIKINSFSTDLTKFIEIEKSWETSSLITRLKLYNTSIKMFSENILFGIGVGRWNLEKNKYGFKEFLLIDSHNGYLSVISQYGLMGLPLLFFIYFYPTVKIFENSRRKINYSFLFYLALINLYISIADLSNSGIFKHQIFCLLAFNAICLLQTDNLRTSGNGNTLSDPLGQI